MTIQDFLQTVIYPSLALLITTGVGAAVVYIRAMAATKQQQADAAALESALQRGKALELSKGTPAAEMPGKVADYLTATSPELAKRTGIMVPGPASDNKVLVPSAAGASRIDATIATPSPTAIIVPATTGAAQ